MQRFRRRAALVVTAGVLALLTACTNTDGSDRTHATEPIPMGSVVPVPTPATSYEQLGALGKYAKALDQEYRVKPDFAEWDLEGDLNCSWVAGGDLQVMGEPYFYNGLPDEERPGPDGSIIHPIAGKAWAASLTARCPELLTDYVRSHIEYEHTAGLEWVKTVD